MLWLLYMPLFQYKINENFVEFANFNEVLLDQNVVFTDLLLVQMLKTI